MSEQKKHQFVVVLVGLPGSGKTTIAKMYNSLVRVSQDDMGSKDAVVAAFKEALSKGQSVIVDRTNIDRRQRKLWVGLAKEAGVTDIRCIFVDVPEYDCINRAAKRVGHPTLPETISLDKLTSVVVGFNKSLELPSLEEGFTSIYRFQPQEGEDSVREQTDSE